MKEFSCGDVVPGCSARFTARTTDEILAAVATHARDDHGLADIPDELVQQVKSNIRDAA